MPTKFEYPQNIATGIDPVKVSPVRRIQPPSYGFNPAHDRMEQEYRELKEMDAFLKYFNTPESIDEYKNYVLGERFKEVLGTTLFKETEPLKATFDETAQGLDILDADTPEVAAYKEVYNRMVKFKGKLPEPNFIVRSLGNNMTSGWIKLLTGEDIWGLDGGGFAVTDKGIKYKGKMLDLTPEQNDVLSDYISRTSGQDVDKSFLDKFGETFVGLSADLPLLAITGMAAAKTMGMSTITQALASSTTFKGRLFGQAIQQAINFNIMGVPQTVEAVKDKGLGGGAESVYHNMMLGLLAASTGTLGTKMFKPFQFIAPIKQLIKTRPALAEEVGGLAGSFGFGYASTKLGGEAVQNSSDSELDAIATGLAFAATHFTNPKSYQRMLREQIATKVKVYTGKPKIGIATQDYFVEKNGELHKIDSKVFGEGKIAELKTTPIPITDRTREEFKPYNELVSSAYYTYGQALKDLRVRENADKLYGKWTTELPADYVKENAESLKSLSNVVSASIKAEEVSKTFSKWQLPEDTSMLNTMIDFSNKHKVPYSDVKNIILKNIPEYFADPEGFLDRLTNQNPTVSEAMVKDLADVVVKVTDTILDAARQADPNRNFILTGQKEPTKDVLVDTHGKPIFGERETEAAGLTERERTEAGLPPQPVPVTAGKFDPDAKYLIFGGNPVPVDVKGDKITIKNTGIEFNKTDKTEIKTVKEIKADKLPKVGDTVKLEYEGKPVNATLTAYRNEFATANVKLEDGKVINVETNKLKLVKGKKAETIKKTEAEIEKPVEPEKPTITEEQYIEEGITKYVDTATKENRKVTDKDLAEERKRLEQEYAKISSETTPKTTVEETQKPKVTIPPEKKTSPKRSKEVLEAEKLLDTLGSPESRKAIGKTAGAVRKIKDKVESVLGRVVEEGALRNKKNATEEEKTLSKFTDADKEELRPLIKEVWDEAQRQAKYYDDALELEGNQKLVHNPRAIFLNLMESGGFKKTEDTAASLAFMLKSIGLKVNPRGIIDTWKSAKYEHVRNMRSYMREVQLNRMKEIESQKDIPDEVKDEFEELQGGVSTKAQVSSDLAVGSFTGLETEKVTPGRTIRSTSEPMPDLYKGLTPKEIELVKSEEAKMKAEGKDKSEADFLNMLKEPESTGKEFTPPDDVKRELVKLDRTIQKEIWNDPEADPLKTAQRLADEGKITQELADIYKSPNVLFEKQTTPRRPAGREAMEKAVAEINEELGEFKSKWKVKEIKQKEGEDVKAGLTLITKDGIEVHIDPRHADRETIAHEKDHNILLLAEAKDVVNRLLKDYGWNGTDKDPSWNQAHENLRQALAGYRASSPIVQRIKEFFQKMANFFHGRGFRNEADFFRKFAEGKIKLTGWDRNTNQAEQLYEEIKKTDIVEPTAVQREEDAVRRMVLSDTPTAKRTRIVDAARTKDFLEGRAEWYDNKLFNVPRSFIRKFWNQTVIQPQNYAYMAKEDGSFIHNDAHRAYNIANTMTKEVSSEINRLFKDKEGWNDNIQWFKLGEQGQEKVSQGFLKYHEDISDGKREPYLMGYDTDGKEIKDETLKQFVERTGKELGWNETERDVVYRQQLTTRKAYEQRRQGYVDMMTDFRLDENDKSTLADGLSEKKLIELFELKKEPTDITDTDYAEANNRITADRELRRTVAETLVNKFYPAEYRTLYSNDVRPITPDTYVIKMYKPMEDIRYATTSWKGLKEGAKVRFLDRDGEYRIVGLGKEKGEITEADFKKIGEEEPILRMEKEQYEQEVTKEDPVFTYGRNEKEAKAKVQEWADKGYVLRESGYYRVKDVMHEPELGKLTAQQLMSLADAGHISYTDQTVKALMNAIKAGRFEQHSINKKFVKGMHGTPEEFNRGIEHFVNEAVNASTRQYGLQKYRNLIRDIDMEYEPLLKDPTVSETSKGILKEEKEYITKLYNNIAHSDKSFSDAARQWAATFYLAMKPSFWYQQGFQGLQTTWHLARGEAKKSFGSYSDNKFLSSYGKTLDLALVIRGRQKGVETGKEKDYQELIDLYDVLEAQGIMGKVGIEELTGRQGDLDYYYATGLTKNIKGLHKAANAVGGAMEKFTRLQAMTVFHDIGKRSGLQGTELQEYIGKQVELSNAKWASIGRPPILSPKTMGMRQQKILKALDKSYFIFKSFSAANMGIYEQLYRNRLWGALGSKMMVGLGMHGITKFPLMATAFALANLFTEDDVEYEALRALDELDHLIGKDFTKIIQKGTPAAFGIDMSNLFSERSILATDVYAETRSYTAGGKLAEAMLGAPYGVASDVLVGAEQTYKKMREMIDNDYLLTADEKERANKHWTRWTPLFARNILNAMRFATDGVELRGKELVKAEDLSTYDVIMKMMSFQPLKISEAYEQQFAGLPAKYSRIKGRIQSLKQIRGDIAKDPGYSAEGRSNEIKNVAKLLREAYVEQSEIRRSKEFMPLIKEGLIKP